MGFFAFLKNNAGKKPVVRVIPPKAHTRRAVKPDNTPLHLKRGWTHNKKKYQGYYRTTYGAWRGEIVKRGDKFDVFIYSPPIEQIRKHSRWPCFKEAGKKRWKIDLAINPQDKDLSAIILYVESLLVKSFER